jgi:hypothetical protein
MTCSYCNNSGKMGSNGYWIKCPYCNNYKDGVIKDFLKLAELESEVGK